jgi:tetratricopeptide (TPR) repeat protein
MARLSVDQMLSKASSLVRQGAIADARQLYEQVLARFPGNRRARQGLASLGAAVPAEPPVPALMPEMTQLAAAVQAGGAPQVARRAAVLLKTYPANAALWNLYGSACAQSGQLQQAEHAFRKAAELAPDFVDPVSNLGALSQDRGDLDQAVAFYRAACALAPANAELKIRLAVGLRQRGDLEAAQQSLEQLLSTTPDHPLALGLLASLLKLRGQYAQTVRCYKRLMAIAPDQMAALKGLSAMPTGMLDPDLVAAMQASLARLDAPPEDQAEALFIAAHLARHAGQPEQAFAQYCAANAAKRAGLKAKIKAAEDKRRAQLRMIRQWRPRPLRATAGVKTLIILGPSRSGKTCLETLLQGSPHVTCGYETRRSGGPLEALMAASASESPPAPLRIEALFYHSEAALVSSGRRVLTNTSPGLINYANLLSDRLPGAYFCYVRRPMRDVAMQIFATNYGAKNTYSYDPAALMRYLKWYDQMRLALAPRLRGLTLNFEQILTRPNQAVAAVEDLLGLDLQLGDLPAKAPPPRDPMADLFEQEFGSLGQ